MIEMEPLEAWHVDRFEPAGHDALSWTRANVEALKSGWLNKAVAVIDGEEVLGLWGLSIENATGRIWLLLSEEGRKRKKSIHKLSKIMLPHLIKEFGLKHMEAEVHSEFETGIRWAERLGFRQADTQPEGRFPLGRQVLMRC